MQLIQLHSCFHGENDAADSTAFCFFHSGGGLGGLGRAAPGGPPRMKKSRMLLSQLHHLAACHLFASIVFVKRVLHVKIFLAGGRCPPDPPVFGWGGKAPPDPPLNGRSSHLIEAAKRGRLDQMIFLFGAADDPQTLTKRCFTRL